MNKLDVRQSPLFKHVYWRLQELEETWILPVIVQTCLLQTAGIEKNLNLTLEPIQDIVDARRRSLWIRTARTSWCKRSGCWWCALCVRFVRKLFSKIGFWSPAWSRTSWGCSPQVGVVGHHQAWSARPTCSLSSSSDHRVRSCLRTSLQSHSLLGTWFIVCRIISWMGGNMDIWHLGFCTRSSPASFTVCAGQHTMSRLCALSKPHVSGISGFALFSRSGQLLRVVQVSSGLEQNSSAMVGSGCSSSLS